MRAAILRIDRNGDEVSTEHVINVLGRLQAQPLPETVATNLQVSQTPLADTARYDSLRAGSDMQEADHA